MITEKQSIRWVHRCPYCNKDMPFETKEEAESYESYHEKRCTMNPYAKRCGTCSMCYKPNEYSLAACDVKGDVTSTSPCRKHVLGKAHSDIMVPILNGDHKLEKYGIVVPRGTIMEYFYGMYVIHRLPHKVREHLGCYADNVLEWRVPPEDVSWVPANEQKDADKGKEQKWISASQ